MTSCRPKSESEKRRERRRRRRERYEANNWKLNPTAPTPYEEWNDVAKFYCDKIDEALSENPTAQLTYRRDSRRQAVPITVDDLAMTLYAVDVVGKKGISYGQLQCCFKRWQKSFHKAKAARLLKLLRDDLNLIVKTRPHVRGSHGACYERPRKGSSEIEQDLDGWLNPNGR